MKSVMLSIQPKWCELIASGRKTIEVRKTVPQEKEPFKVYIYQTKKKWIYRLLKKLGLYQGKVIGEFVCDRIEEFKITDRGVQFKRFSALYETALSVCEMHEYASGKSILYGWHISDLKIYDAPKEWGEFSRKCVEYGSDNPNCDGCKFFIDGRSYEYDESDCAFAGHPSLTRPPMSWCYCEELRNETVSKSIQSRR